MGIDRSFELGSGPVEEGVESPQCLLSSIVESIKCPTLGP